MVEVHTSTPLSVDSTLDEHATVLRAYVDQQRAHEARLREELSAVGDRIKRGEKAIAALVPATVEVAEKSGPKTGKRQSNNPARQSAIANWVPSEKLMAKVLAGLEEYGNEENGITINRLADKTGVAGESVKRSLEVLRSKGQARFLGVRSFPTKQPGRTTKAKAYKPMPAHHGVDDDLSRTSEALIGSLNGAGNGRDD